MMPIVLEVTLLKHHLLQAQLLAEGEDARLARLRQVLDIGMELVEELEYCRKAPGGNVVYLNDFTPGRPRRRPAGQPAGGRK